jgi:AMP nucleosidase
MHIEETIAATISELTRLHARAVATLRADIAAFAADGTLPRRAS